MTLPEMQNIQLHSYIDVILDLKILKSQLTADEYKAAARLAEMSKERLIALGVQNIPDVPQ
ncbi:MAG: hypothetical protein LBN42_00945 [Oscillospiraceae bacterium]|jgi:hypothetical protein|nr:hypothetical protein [Oscillospiraceae bacterium]